MENNKVKNKRSIENKEGNYLRNIKVNYIYKFLMGMNITHGIWMIYLISKGFSLFEAGLMEGIFHITSFVMEVPTGAIADVFGKKKSRLIGIVFSIISAVLMVTSESFVMVALSFVICALSYNFESGSGEALVYDSLKYSDKEDSFIKVNGKIEMLWSIASACALLLGGFLGNKSYELVYVVMICISCISLLVGMFFREVPIEKMISLDEEEKEINQPKKLGIIDAIRKQYVDSYVALKGDKKLVYLIAFSAFEGISITVTFFYLQLLWKGNGVSEGEIGVYLAVASVFGFLGAAFSEKIEKKFGEKNVITILPIILVIAIASMALNSNIISFMAYSVIAFIDAIIFIALRDYLNRLIESDKRATILSFESTAFSLAMIIVFPIFGLIGDMFTIQNAFLIFAGVLLFMVIINIIQYNKDNKSKEKIK